MKQQRLLLTALLAVLCAAGAMACTSAIVSGKLTANGRPLMWKNRDTNDLNNRLKRFAATASAHEFVAVFDARDLNDTAAWMGYNATGFAVMNTASYNLNSDDVPESGMDKEGVVMRLALERCATVDDFGRLLDTLPKPMGVEANFGVIDAQGGAAYFETGNYGYKRFDVADSPQGYLTRTNYSYSGREGEGWGYVREQNELRLLAPHLASRGVIPAVFTEELSRSFYHSLLGDVAAGQPMWIVDQDFIPRRISSGSFVIEGVLPGESPLLTTMWTALGYPPCADVVPVWLTPGGLPEALVGQGSGNRAPQCDVVLERKRDVFPLEAGNGNRYINYSALYNQEGTGWCQRLIPANHEAYRQGYAKLQQMRQQLAPAAKGKAAKKRGKKK